MRSEVQSFTSPKSNNSILRQPLTLDVIESFRWGRLLHELSAQCPLLSACITSAATFTPRKAMHGGRREGVVDSALVGVVVSMVAAAHKPTMRLFQNILGIQLWLGNCKNEVHIILYFRHICVNKFHYKVVLLPLCYKLQ